MSMMIKQKYTLSLFLCVPITQAICDLIHQLIASGVNRSINKKLSLPSIFPLLDGIDFLFCFYT